MGRTLDLAILGTRGIPANYGGFETFAEELSTRLAARGHRVSVYCRSHYVDRHLRSYRGVRLRNLPAIRSKYLETVSHTALSMAFVLLRRYDLVLICNAANSFLSWIPRLAGTRVVLNVDGIERMRRKWNRAGKIFHRWGERFANWFPHRVVSDAKAIQDYYLQEFDLRTCFIPYGASLERSDSQATLDRLGIQPGRYLLYVSRLEPENNAHLVLEAFKQSGVGWPLVLVGDAPYSREYIRGLRQAAQGANVLLPGAIYGPGYRELLSHCRCYFQASEVGGTHPALIEAMGTGALVVANDTPENREVVADAGLLLPFREVEQLSNVMQEIGQDPSQYQRLRIKARERVGKHYDWEEVVNQYEELFRQTVS